ncbi:TIM barrel protein [Fusobacterium sp. SYSU M8D902]|uniref:sugar phosphate isomerase/epimerase family protein n=1 Tax=Fusobacterium sp. SYSU M8D902 TaxID=3159562 RepID=UPI0032E3DC82
MYKLLNICDFLKNDELEKNYDKYRKYGIDYFELIKYSDVDNKPLKDKIKGYHLRFFPTWLDLYLCNQKEIFSRLIDENTIRGLCGGITKEEMLDYYRKELEIAKELEVEYVVLHACNIDIFESMTYNFRFSDRQILEKTVEFINEIFNEEKYSFTLLLENLWWPGLKLNNYEEVDYLVKNIRYKNIGFMLDTGHMLNTNLELKNSNEAVEYILENINRLKEYKELIYGVHLNYSLSGDYVKNSIENNLNKELRVDEVLQNIYYHISKIDYHDPFENSGVREILKKLPLKYLVLELLGKTQEEIEEKIKRQQKFL